MKYLDTLRTNPHKYFKDIDDDFLFKYAEDEFDLVLNDISEIKDIINIYSHKMYYSNKYESLYPNIEFTFPIDSDIINASISTYIKLKRAESIKFKVTDPKNSNKIKFKFSEEEFLEDLLELDIVSAEASINNSKMESVTDMIYVNPINIVYPDYLYKVIAKKHNVIKPEEELIYKGSLYIDLSSSMSNNFRLFNLVLKHLKFKQDKIELQVYSVTNIGIVFLGIVTNYEEFIEITSGLELVYGKINIESVVEHISSNNYTSTFITDSEDFDISLINNYNFNLITLDNGGKITTTK